MSDPRTSLVGAGYDTMVETWEAWKARIRDDPRDEWCDELVARLPAGAHVVELGCGGGTDETRVLAERFRLTGVDLSEEQLRVRESASRVPSFVHADLTDSSSTRLGRRGRVPSTSSTTSARAPRGALRAHPRAGSCRAASSWRRSARATTRAGPATCSARRPYFSGFQPETNRRLLAEAGFELLRDELVTIREPEGDATFHWVLARR